MPTSPRALARYDLPPSCPSEHHSIPLGGHQNKETTATALSAERWATDLHISSHRSSGARAVCVLQTRGGREAASMGVHVVTVLEATILSAAGVAWLVSDVHGTHRRHCQRTYLIFFFLCNDSALAPEHRRETDRGWVALGLTFVQMVSIGGRCSVTYLCSEGNKILESPGSQTARKVLSSPRVGLRTSPGWTLACVVTLVKKREKKEDMESDGE